jgi:hypothetical protein
MGEILRKRTKEKRSKIKEESSIMRMKRYRSRKIRMKAKGKSIR